MSEYPHSPIGSAGEGSGPSWVNGGGRVPSGAGRGGEPGSVVGAHTFGTLLLLERTVSIWVACREMSWKQVFFFFLEGGTETIGCRRLCRVVWRRVTSLRGARCRVRRRGCHRGRRRRPCRLAFFYLPRTKAFIFF